MVYVAGRGFKLGLQLGQAREADKREADKRAAQYDEDRLRALDEHLQDRARMLAERERALQEQAQGEMNQLELGQTEQDAMQEAGGMPPGMAGPPSPAGLDSQARIQDYFARVGDVASRMKPENRPQYLLDAKERIKKQVTASARGQVAAGIQDRLAKGSFNFLDEPEPNEAIAQKVEMLLKALDDESVDPIKASELEAQVLEVVRKENERRLAQQRGTEAIDAEVASAKAAGNEGLAQDMETIRAMWGTGELKPDDVIDRIFEAKTGRKTARASAQAGPKVPTPFEVRAAAIKLWQGMHPEATELPTEAELVDLEQLLVPPQPTPGPTSEDVVRAITGSVGSQATVGGETTPGAPLAGGGAPGAGAAGSLASSAKDAVPPGISMVGRKLSPAERRKFGRPTVPGGKPAASAQTAQARPWAKLKPKERTDAETKLLAVAAEAGDLRAALAELGIDPASVPPALRKRLIDAATKKAGPSLGEAVSHLHPGAGGM